MISQFCAFRISKNKGVTFLAKNARGTCESTWKTLREMKEPLKELIPSNLFLHRPLMVYCSSGEGPKPKAAASCSKCSKHDALKTSTLAFAACLILPGVLGNLMSWLCHTIRHVGGHSLLGSSDDIVPANMAVSD